MPKDRDQLTPDDPDDAEHLATHRGQGTGGTGLDRLDEPVADEGAVDADPGGDPA